MIRHEIKSILDKDLNSEKILKLHPKNVNVGAIEIFQRIFVEVLNFDIVRGTFEGVAESVSTRDWNKQAEAVDACIIAERDDFRVLYVGLRKLTRTAQRYAVSSIIRERWASKGEFIVIFYAQGSDVWHLVCPYVTEGRTILRRYVVGIGEKHRTVSENLANMDITIETPLFERVQDAFKVKPVTEQFYGDYKNYFSKIKECIRSLGIDIRNSKRYSHLFLNRLMFVYFIQKKGWIGDNKEFVKWFLEAYREFGEKDRFHEKWLNNLFFKAMNKPPREKKFSAGFPSEVCEVLNRIPYLNGGLFEKDDVDELGIELSDSLVMGVIEGFLENYNFTITEESPFDLDIAVDPAMLGKIYESLIAEEERGKAGIFYTPRIEVDLMCRLALYEYFQQQRTDKSGTLEEALVNQLLEKVIDFLFTPLEEWKTKDESEFRVLKKLLDSVKVVDPACGSGAFLVGMLSVLQELYTKMGIEADYNLEENIINNNLYGVDIKDWAIRMAEFRLWLALVESEDEVPDVEPVLPNFSFKLQVGDSIVQKVGDDFIKLEKIKGELEKEIGEDLDKLETLKKRHFRGEKGLIVDIEKAQRRILDKYIDKKISVLQKKKSQQTTLEGGVSAQARREIKAIESKISLLQESKENLRKARRAKLFVWDLDFPEVMLQGGFDVVIANPPYVRQEKIIRQDLDPEELKSRSSAQLKKLRSEYKEDLVGYILETYGMEVGKRCDLYLYFFFKGLELLNPKGSMVYISSNSWLDVDYGKYLQEALLKKIELECVIDNSAKRSFEESEINTVISVIRKGHGPNILSGETCFIVFKRPFEDVIGPANMKKALLKINMDFRTIQIENEPLSLSTEKNLKIRKVPRKSLWKMGGGTIIESQTELNTERKNIVPSGSYSGYGWGVYLRAPEIYFRIMDECADKLIKITDVVDDIRPGAYTGLNDFYYFECEKGREIRDELEKQYKLPLIRRTTQVKRPFFDSKTIDTHILVCNVSKKELRRNKHLKVLEYIKWGAKQKTEKKQKVEEGIPWPEVPSVKNRKPGWWSLPEKDSDPTHLFMGYVINDRFTVTFSNNKITSDRCFHRIFGDKASLYKLLAVLCSTVTNLFTEIIGTTALGQGALKFETRLLKKLRVVNPDEISIKKADPVIRKLGKREIGSIFEEIGAENAEEVSLDKIREERRELDNLVMGDILGLTEDEQIAVYQGVINLVKARLEKAQSV